MICNTVSRSLGDKLYSSINRPSLRAQLSGFWNNLIKSPETILFVVPIESNTVISNMELNLLSNTTKFRILKNFGDKLYNTGIEFNSSHTVRVEYIKNDNNDCSFNYSIADGNYCFQSFEKSYNSIYIFISENIKFIAELKKLNIKIEKVNFNILKKSNLPKRERGRSKCLNITAGCSIFAPKHLRNAEDLCDKVFFPVYKNFYEILELLYSINERDAKIILSIFEKQIDHYCYDNENDVERTKKINNKLINFFEEKKLTVNAEFINQYKLQCGPLKVAMNPKLEKLMSEYQVCTAAPNLHPQNWSNSSGSWEVQRKFITNFVNNLGDQIGSFENCGVKTAILNGMRVLFVHAPGSGNNKGAAYNAKSDEEWITLMHKVTSLSIAMQIITLCYIDNVDCPQLSNFITKFLEKVNIN